MRLHDAFRCEPTELALNELREFWGWKLPAKFDLIVVSAFGDVFFADERQEISWLNTGVGEITLVASDEAEFWKMAQGEDGFNWFMPDLVNALLKSGKKRELGQCYTYAVLPVFPDGKYDVWNFASVDAREHFGITGHIHREINDLPDGTQVKIVFEP